MGQAGDKDPDRRENAIIQVVHNGNPPWIVWKGFYENDRFENQVKMQKMKDQIWEAEGRKNLATEKKVWFMPCYFEVPLKGGIR